MAIIAGTTVDWTLSPRIVDIPVAESSLTADDSQDTLLDLEDKEEGIIWPHLREMSGGQDLGGGTTVGFTIEYQNSQIAFGRTSSRSQGTVTTGSSTQLIDASADFVIDAVQRGDWVVNFTDLSVTEVLSVVDLNTLNVRPLSDGTSDTFTVADVYKVWEVAEAELGGGNHVAVDGVGSSITPTFPTFGRSFARTSASSATATGLESIEAAVLQGGISVDPGSPYTITSQVAGVLGSREFPLNNMADVLTLSISRGVAKIFVLDDLTITGVDLSNEFHEFIGDKRTTVLTVDPTADTTGDNFTRLTLQGDLGGSNAIEDCLIGVITNVSGTMDNSAFLDSASITLNGDLSMDRNIVERVGFVWPTFVIGDNNLNTVDYFGGFTVSGMIAGGGTNINFSNGFAVIDATCTGGTLLLRGEMRQPLVDDSGAVVIVDNTSSTIINEMHERLDLDATKPNTYTKNPDGSITITGTNFVLTETINPSNSKESTVQRS